MATNEEPSAEDLLLALIKSIDPRASIQHADNRISRQIDGEWVTKQGYYAPGDPYRLYWEEDLPKD